MISDFFRRFLICVALPIVMSGQLLAQEENPLIAWQPDGPSNYAYLGNSGYMNMWQDGTCWTAQPVGASVVEEWACGVGEEAYVSGSAGLTYCLDDSGESYPCGVWAMGSAQSPPGTPVDQQYGEDNCDGFSDSSGGRLLGSVVKDTGEVAELLHPAHPATTCIPGKPVLQITAPSKAPEAHAHV